MMLELLMADFSIKMPLIAWICVICGILYLGMPKKNKSKQIKDDRWKINYPCHKCGAERQPADKFLTPCPCCGDNVPF